MPSFKLALNAACSLLDARRYRLTRCEALSQTGGLNLSRRILILERDVLQGFALQSELMLADEHVIARVTDDAREAWELTQEWKPQAILANHDSVDGAWLCRQVKEDVGLHETPVILMGPRSDVMPAHLIRQRVVTFSGCDGYFPLPVHPVLLRNYLDVLLATGRIQADLLLSDDCGD